jgi:hypothetical protein
VPFVDKTALKLLPGSIVPEFHAPLFDVEVCGMLSLFVHVTVVPAATARGFPNAADPSTEASEGIVTAAVGPFGAGIGVGPVAAPLFPLLLHPTNVTMRPVRASTPSTRIRFILLLDIRARRVPR